VSDIKDFDKGERIEQLSSDRILLLTALMDSGAEQDYPRSKEIVRNALLELHLRELGRMGLLPDRGKLVIEFSPDGEAVDYDTGEEEDLNDPGIDEDEAQAAADRRESEIDQIIVNWGAAMGRDVVVAPAKCPRQPGQPE
jgi:hypothetical protein